MHRDLFQLRASVKGVGSDRPHGSRNEHTADGNLFAGCRSKEIFADLRDERFTDALRDLGDRPAPLIRADDKRSVLQLSERPLFFKVFDRLLPRGGALHGAHLRKKLIRITVGEICAFIRQQYRLCLGVALLILQQNLYIVRPQHLLRKHQPQQLLPTEGQRKQALALRSDIPKIFFPRPSFPCFTRLIRHCKPKHQHLSDHRRHR